MKQYTTKPTKFKTKHWVEINDDARKTYDKANQIKFKTSILNSSLCGYSDSYILLKGLYQSHHKQEIIQIIDIKN